MNAGMASTPLRIGSLFSGYGGLDLGVMAALGDCRLMWVSDIEPGPSTILHHHHPDIPNLGDVTRVDWGRVADVDVICGGSPCQDVSMAGRRAGMRPGTRSGLWSFQADAVAAKRPSLMVWENVAGALSGRAVSRLDGSEPDGTPHMRALGRVLGDLAGLGYDAVWRTLEAADVGAPHHRRRLFVTAWPMDGRFSGDGMPWGVWDGDADAWIMGRDLFDRPMVFMDPWPAMGLMAGGRVYRLGERDATVPGNPGPVLPVLPTPDASQGGRGTPSDPVLRRRLGHMVTLADAVAYDPRYRGFRPALPSTTV